MSHRAAWGHFSDRSVSGGRERTVTVLGTKSQQPLVSSPQSCLLRFGYSKNTANSLQEQTTNATENTLKARKLENMIPALQNSHSLYRDKAYPCDVLAKLEN